MVAAVIRGPGRMAVEEVPVPVPAPDEVLVEVDLCGVCGTDLHMALDGWAPPGSWGGHEWTGTVVEVGADADRWGVGDAVVGALAPRCGSCATCRAGRSSLCLHREEPGSPPRPGAFATFIAAPARDLVARPVDLDPRAAALAEPLAVALHAVGLGRVRPGQRAMVLGAGPIGALTIIALRTAGAGPITVVEPGANRRDLALAVGADTVVHPDDLDVPAIAEPDRIVGGAVDIVLECSGKAAAMEAGLAQLTRGGTLVLVGAGIEAPRFDPNRILLNELTVTGAYNHDDDGFDRALAILADGTVPVDALVEPDEVGLDGLLDALHALADGRLAGKVLVRP